VPKPAHRSGLGFCWRRFFERPLRTARLACGRPGPRAATVVPAVGKPALQRGFSDAVRAVRRASDAAARASRKSLPMPLRRRVCRRYRVGPQRRCLAARFPFGSSISGRLRLFLLAGRLDPLRLPVSSLPLSPPWPLSSIPARILVTSSVGPGRSARPTGPALAEPLLGRHLLPSVPRSSRLLFRCQSAAGFCVSQVASRLPRHALVGVAASDVPVSPCGGHRVRWALRLLCGRQILNLRPLPSSCSLPHWRALIGPLLWPDSGYRRRPLVDQDV